MGPSAPLAYLVLEPQVDHAVCLVQAQVPGEAGARAWALSGWGGAGHKLWSQRWLAL